MNEKTTNQIDAAYLEATTDAAAAYWWAYANGGLQARAEADANFWNAIDNAYAARQARIKAGPAARAARHKAVIAAWATPIKIVAAASAVFNPAIDAAQPAAKNENA